MVRALKKAGPKRYVKDRAIFTLDDLEYSALLDALIVIYKDVESVDDPLIKAKTVIKRCCEGTKDDGSPWRAAPPTFEGRLKIFGFDKETMAAVPGYFEHRSRNANVKHGKISKYEKVVPKELRVKSKKGDPANSSSVISYDEKKEVGRRFRQMLKDYPNQIKTETDQDLAKQLAKILVTMERVMDVALASGELPKNNNLDTYMIGNAEKIMKLLQIDANSREKAKSDASEGTLADLLDEFEEYLKNDFHKLSVEHYLVELGMMLRKFDRVDDNGMPEINNIVFERLTGLTVEQARNIIKNPYYESMEDLMAQAKKYSDLTVSQRMEVDNVLRQRYLKYSVKDREKMKERLMKQTGDKLTIRRILSRSALAEAKNII